MAKYSLVFLFIVNAAIAKPSFSLIGGPDKNRGFEISQYFQEYAFGFAELDISEREIASQNKTLILENQLLEQKKHEQKALIISLVIIIVLVIIISTVVVKSSQTTKEVIAEKKLLFQIAQEEEREHISRELHDHLSSTLAGIKAYLSPKTPNYTKIIEHLDDAYAVTRRISHTLNAETIKKFGFREACLDFIELINANDTISFQEFGQPLVLQEDQALMLYRIIQELLTNATKHAHATQVKLNIHWEAKAVLISVEDNGVGFDVHSKKTGIGITNIRKRIEILKADIEFLSTPQGGTSVLITMPTN